MGRGTKWGLGGLAIVLLSACVIVYFRSDQNRTPQAAEGFEPIPVIAATVQARDVPIVLTGLGAVTPLNTATVRSQVTGLITSVDFQEGQSVKKGDMLAQIDPRTYQAQLDEAEATLAHDQTHLKNAQENLTRYSNLAKQDSIALQQVANQQAAVEELDSQIKNDQAAIENAKAQLSYTSLVAPFDGVTGFRLLDVGNIIHPPTTTTTGVEDALVVVTEIRPMGVIFSLSTQYLPEIQSSIAKEPAPLQAIAFSQDGKTELDRGSLLVVNNQADAGSGTVQLKAQFPNEKRQLWPGAFVNVQLVLSTEKNGLTIPLDAIQQGPQGPIVYVIGQDKKVSIRPVSMRQSLAGEALVDKGLSAGETVVVRGQYRLSPGTLVTLADPNNPGAVPNPTTAGAGMLP
jgi:multidrug efflux system membrane fusion protein